MKFRSTSSEQSAQIGFKDAVLNNLPKDGGLFFPAEIPEISPAFLEKVGDLTLPEIAVEVLSPFCKEDISQTDLQSMVERVFDYPIPLVEVEKGIHCLELFHGPTYAFKDIGAKFLAECLAYFTRGQDRKTKVLVATSGDTGGAVANGFLGVDGVEVVILYPKGKVSDLQEKQLTTLGQNIIALEVEGNFDDCQSLVKQAFADEELTQEMHLSSANSINIARWLPQSLFYWVPLMHGIRNQVISVPSGNYGNLTSGVLANKMGVPIQGFIAASNANDSVPRYLQTEKYDPHPTIATIANAMDVSDPSNFKRLLSLYDGSYREITKKLEPLVMHDDQIRETIRVCKSTNDYFLDPHSAIAYSALKESVGKGVFLGTAHYCKFLPTMNAALGIDLSIPDFANGLMEREKKAIEMEADYGEFKSLLRSY